MEKTTIIEFISKTGKKVSVKVVRHHGKEAAVVNLDGDKIKMMEMQDSFKLSVKVGELTVECCQAPQYFKEVGGLAIYGSITDYRNKTRKNIYIPIDDEVYDKIMDAIQERLTDDLSEREEEEIRLALDAMASGKVLPRAEREKKIKEYNDMFNEGGDGYNPYIEYCTEEDIAVLKKFYPEQFK